jgi:hypothetical protein
MVMKQTLIEAATETCMGIPQVNPDLLIKQVVGECVLAILATDTRDIVYTTYDRDQVAGIISRVVDQVRNHFKETQ